MNLYKPTLEDRAKYKDMSVVVAVPCKDNESPIKFAKELVNMVAYSWMNGLKVYQMGCTERMVIHWARNDLAKMCRDHINEYTGKKFTHILWLDDDHLFSPDALCALARYSDLDVVSGLYYGRQKPLPVAYVKDKNDDKYKHYPLIEVPPTLCEVDAVGFGALLMRREILDRLEEPWFAFNRAGEDVYFCVHAKEQGVKIHLDGSVQIGHIGDYSVITHLDHKKYLEENEELFSDRIRVGLGGKIV